MREKTYRVREVARLAGVTVRTLHHYDRIGLLVPAGRTAAGYRLYDNSNLLRLQQILVARELGMPLTLIKRLLDDPGYDRASALEAHRTCLVKDLRVTSRRIQSIDKALAILRGDIEMKPDEIFDGFEPEEYKDEARERWGETDAYKESARRTKGYAAADWKRLKTEYESLMQRLAVKLDDGSDATHQSVLQLAEEHRVHIDRWFYPCSHQMHCGLADMYEADERFRATFEKHGEGLAGFLVAAIRANAGKRETDSA